MPEKVNIFGKDIFIQDNLCSNSKKILTHHLKLNLYVSITNVCPGSCKFCNNKTIQNTTKTSIKFDFEKFANVLIELERKKLLNRISITGGEPLLDLPLLDKVLFTIKNNTKKSHQITINTNGINLKKVLELENLSIVDGIHISRHHYDDEINDKIFGFKTATTDDIKYVIENCENKKLIRLNCLLIKEYISSQSEVQKYLDYACSLGIFRVGFVGLMPINQYSIDNFVDYKKIFKRLNKSSLKIVEKHNQDICDCANFVYVSKSGKVLEYYARCVRKLKTDFVGQFNYSCDNHLKSSFDEVIV